MALETPGDSEARFIGHYQRLGEHLDVIDEPLASFAAAHGYIRNSRLSGGRYPHRRITQDGIISRSIHIAMGYRPTGQRFDLFFPEIPYTISGLACIDDHERHQRWHAPFLHTQEIPFSTLLNVLPTYLDQFYDYLSRLSSEQIYAFGLATVLGPMPKSGNT